MNAHTPLMSLLRAIAAEAAAVPTCDSFRCDRAPVDGIYCDKCLAGRKARSNPDGEFQCDGCDTRRDDEVAYCRSCAEWTAGNRLDADDDAPEAWADLADYRYDERRSDELLAGERL